MEREIRGPGVVLYSACGAPEKSRGTAVVAVGRGSHLNIYTKNYFGLHYLSKVVTQLYKGSYLNIRLNNDDAAGKPVRTLI
jgi:hypothetical protein